MKLRKILFLFFVINMFCVDNVLAISNDVWTNNYFIKQMYTQGIYASEDDYLVTDSEYYLNSDWIIYINSSDEEKSEYELVPQKYLYVHDYSEDVVNEEVIDGVSINDSSYDLRDYGLVTQPRNQSTLGLCWAFASAGSFESVMLKLGLSDINNPITFSERQLDYATGPVSGIQEGYNPYSYRSNLGDGGYFANEQFAVGISPVTHSRFGLYNTSKISKSMYDVFSYDNIDYSATGTYVYGGIYYTNSSSTRQNYVNAVKSHLINYGALYVSELGPSHYYAGACYYPEGQLINHRDNCNPTDEGYHAMLIIGWDDNYSYQYCKLSNTTSTNIDSCSGTVISGQGAFILKNSWGGNLPYLYLAYDSTINYITGVTQVVAKDWNNSYDEYKNFNNSLIINGYSQIDYFRNQKVSESIKRINFIHNSSSSVQRRVEISVDGSDNWQYVGTVNVTKPGLYSIDLSNIVLTDSQFSVRISGNNIKDITVFTNYTDNNTDALADTNISDLNNIYTNTRNIPTGDIVTYKLYDGDIDVSSAISVSNNYVLNNVVMPVIDWNGTLLGGEYVLKTLYNGEILDSQSFSVAGPTITISTVNVLGNCAYDLTKLYNGFGGVLTVNVDVDDIADNQLLSLRILNGQVDVTSSFNVTASAISNGRTTVEISVPSSIQSGNYTLALSYNGAKDKEYDFTVYQYISVTQIQAQDIAILINEQKRINVSVFPSTAMNKSVSYRSLDTTIATVNENGLVEGKKYGQTEIVITARDGSNINTRIKVVVDYPELNVNSRLYNITTINGRKIIKSSSILETNRQTFVKQFDNLLGQIYESNGTTQVTDSNDIIKTGDIIKNGSFQYAIVIAGDINGDGHVTSLDYVRIKNHIMANSNADRITDTIKALAADVNSDNGITSLDYVMIKNYIMSK